MRLSRGRSTPTRRAMLSGVPFGVAHSGFGRVASWCLPDGCRAQAPATAPEVIRWCSSVEPTLVGRACRDQLAITLWGVQLLRLGVRPPREQARFGFAPTGSPDSVRSSRAELSPDA